MQTCEKNQPFKLSNFKVNFVDAHKVDKAYDQSMLVDFIIQGSAPKKFQDISQAGGKEGNTA